MRRLTLQVAPNLRLLRTHIHHRTLDRLNTLMDTLRVAVRTEVVALQVFDFVDRFLDVFQLGGQRLHTGLHTTGQPSRPGAGDLFEQLRTLGNQINVPVFSEPSDPVTVARRGLEEARAKGRDVLIVDTAGRLAIDTELMAQVREISETITRMYSARRGMLVVSPISFSTAIAQPTLLSIGDT